MEKPVIILGGGVWGSLLAWRLKETLPHVRFRLYEESSMLGNHRTCTFRETDCGEAIKWLRPLISKSWTHHHIKFPKFEKWITSSYHLMQPKQLHEYVSARLGDDLRLNNTLTPEFALKEGDFVIDTRNSCHYKKSGFKKHLSLHIEISEDHNLIAPVIFDGGVTQKERFRNISYFPMTERSLIVSDTWYSENQKIDIDEMRRALCDTIYAKGWRISKIIREESGFTVFPISSPVIREEGRVISLAGLFHETTGCSMGSATELIDKMVATSFRFGELKEVVKTFRKENESDREYLRYLNRQLIEQKHHQLFEAIYAQSNPLLERFSKGKLSYLDRSRITLGQSHLKLGGLLNMVLQTNLYPGVQVSKS